MSFRRSRAAIPNSWPDMIGRRPSSRSAPKSGQTLLALVYEGELGNAGGVDPFHLSRQLAHLGEEFPALKEEMLQRYQRLNGRRKSILKSALIELADAPVIRALVRGYAADDRPYDGGLANALRNAALGRR